jgi:hypothetical protein
MDSLSAYLTTLGALTLLLSWIVMLISTSKEDFVWGLCTLLLPPISYAYALLRLDVAKDGMALAVAGSVLFILGIS